jgi:hypothetical protein
VSHSELVRTEATLFHANFHASDMGQPVADVSYHVWSSTGHHDSKNRSVRHMNLLFQLFLDIEQTHCCIQQQVKPAGSLLWCACCKAERRMDGSGLMSVEPLLGYNVVYEVPHCKYLPTTGMWKVTRCVDSSIM